MPYKDITTAASPFLDDTRHLHVQLQITGQASTPTFAIDRAHISTKITGTIHSKVDVTATENDPVVNCSCLQHSVHIQIISR